MMFIETLGNVQKILKHHIIIINSQLLKYHKLLSYEIVEYLLMIIDSNALVKTLIGRMCSSGYPYQKNSATF